MHLDASFTMVAIIGTALVLGMFGLFLGVNAPRERAGFATSLICVGIVMLFVEAAAVTIAIAYRTDLMTTLVPSLTIAAAFCWLYLVAILTYSIKTRRQRAVQQ